MHIIGFNYQNVKYLSKDDAAVGVYRVSDLLPGRDLFRAPYSGGMFPFSANITKVGQ